MRRPLESTRTHSLFSYTTVFRAAVRERTAAFLHVGPARRWRRAKRRDVAAEGHAHHRHAAEREAGGRGRLDARGAGNGAFGRGDRIEVGRTVLEDRKSVV